MSGTARDNMLDAEKLLTENSERRQRLPRWRWLKRKRLASEWMQIATYHQWMWAIAREEENPQ